MAGRELQIYKKIFWTLNDMTKQKIEGYGFGNKIYSPTTEIVFGDDIMEWSLCFYPGGEIERFKDYIGLSLHLNNNDSTEFEVNYILGIVGRVNKTVVMHATGEEFKVCADWGWHDFLKREELYDPSKEFLTDDKLTIFCELTITANEVSKSDKTSSLYQGLLSLSKKMFESEVFADFRIWTNDGKVLKAHKAVLVVRSSAFKELLTGEASNDVVNLLKVPEDASIMKQVLRFVYCNEVENLKEIASKLIVAAEKYDLGYLKKLCINSMIASLTAENVLKTLLIADGVTKAKKLKEKCFDMISSNFHQVSSNSVEWEKLPKHINLEIIEHNANKGENTIRL